MYGGKVITLLIKGTPPDTGRQHCDGGKVITLLLLKSRHREATLCMVER